MNKVEPTVGKTQAERREFQRVPVDLPGRLFVPAEEYEARCTVTDLSPGGAAIDCEIVPDTGTPVVIYLDNFGRFEGPVARSNDNGFGFGVRFTCTATKSERTAEQLRLFVNKELAPGHILRRHDRTPTKETARITRADGQFVPCEVLDRSTSGVSLKTDMRLPIGEFVLIGHIAGRIARHHDRGIGIEFVGQTDRRSQERPTAKLALAS